MKFIKKYGLYMLLFLLMLIVTMLHINGIIDSNTSLVCMAITALLVFVILAWDLYKLKQVKRAKVILVIGIGAFILNMMIYFL